ncbi:heavy-metal-associated domain-containing protein [[Limnothrix rosea] IAM M-220]|uniref:heavy-metal-associated domain-containing protein n=1 Tax=[Limnothrix rosea] IAM M-220 TaxID=454133 RepID=UPI000963CF16|nr:heavy-metal-associated domain-containing protein [[Limnothrix rosea] IAM M-220]OKH19599.1 heavy metal transporter [[Limnothrix rosea] IAM M-220]
MSLKIKVPTIACEVCGNTITKAIESQQEDAQVSVDVTNKIVTVDTSATEAEIKSIIVESGHTPE